jgi:signal transduction histidine kinase
MGHIAAVAQMLGKTPVDIGVPVESAETIFELFRTTKNDGMGVGLWLSRAVMDNHRGSLSLDMDCTKGAKFIMQFATTESLIST